MVEVLGTSFDHSDQTQLEPFGRICRSVEMKKNIVIPLLVLLVVGVMLAVKGFFVLRESSSKVDALVNANIDMSQLSDGVYTGSCDSGLVNAEVRVEVKDHKIVGIELVKHDNLKGKPTEAILVTVQSGLL